MRRIYLTAILCLSATLLSAREPDERFSLSLMGIYGWNETWHNYGGLDIIGYLPFSNHVEATVAAEVHNPKTAAITATVRPKFHLGTGVIFIDGSIHYRTHISYGIADFNIAASMGYRMNYFCIQLGATSHLIFDLERKAMEKSGTVSEPLNLLYRVAFHVRPDKSGWNIGGGISNYTDFEYERTWLPMFFLDGHLDFNERLSVLCRADLKPAGTFHGTAEFWGASVRAGVKYTF